MLYLTKDHLTYALKLIYPPSPHAVLEYASVLYIISLANLVSPDQYHSVQDDLYKNKSELRMFKMFGYV